MCRGIECSCISLISVSLNLLVNWISSILDERENFYKSIDKFSRAERDRGLATRVIDDKLLYEKIHCSPSCKIHLSPGAIVSKVEKKFGCQKNKIS